MTTELMKRYEAGPERAAAVRRRGDANHPTERSESMSENYDSAQDTKQHIERVGLYIDMARRLLKLRAEYHDASKLLSPEKECFDEITPLLKGTTYGSEEYRAALRKMKPAIDHHQKNNRHHPEYFENGIDGMNLIDLVEMICDWKAASERHADGNIYRSLEINRERFGMSGQLVSILKNTVDYLFIDKKENV